MSRIVNLPDRLDVQSDPVARARADWRAADLAALEAECAVTVAHRRLKHATDHLAEVGGLAMGVTAAAEPAPVPGSHFQAVELKVPPIPFPAGESLPPPPEMVWQPGASEHSVLNRDPNRCTRCESPGRVTVKLRAHKNGATSEEFVCAKHAAELRDHDWYIGETEVVKECAAEPAPTPVAPAIRTTTGPEPEPPYSPAANEKGEPFYGWDITYLDNRHHEQHCHYVGTEKKARGKARLRTGLMRLTACKGLTREQYERGYGKGRM